MKIRSSLFVIAFLLFAQVMQGAWYSHLPYSYEQPDGSVFSCYVSGDEHQNRMHDQDGYTLIPGSDGFLYYAVVENGSLKAGTFRAGSVNPASVGLAPGICLPENDVRTAGQTTAGNGNIPATAPHSGLLNNLVIYIRFQDDPEFVTERSSFDALFNQEGAASLKSYYEEVSYNQLNISSSHYPACSAGTNRSYRDSHNRAYFLPYNATSNTGGYQDENERISREHTLLKNAIEYIIVHSPVPSTLNLDSDNDGRIDNITFVVRGNNAAWSQLLWSHSWQLFSYDVILNGKHAWGYNFIPENQADVRTLCHEFFHSLGAPDLYHYAQGNLQAVGNWDIMESGSGHMGAWMKYRYSSHSWIADIPEITRSGTYSLNPLTSETGQCYRISSPFSTSEFFILEYRKASGNFESGLPGSGILVYRIDTSFSGNAAGPPDEVYLYRPSGDQYSNGSISNAYFSMESGRTMINDGSDPSCFLPDGSPGGLQIYDIGQAGGTIQFSIIVNEIEAPGEFTALPSGQGANQLSWIKNQTGDPVMIVASSSGIFGTPVDGNLFPAGSQLPGGGIVLYNGTASAFLHSGLPNHENWHYRIYSVTAGQHYSNPAFAESTTICGSYTLPFTEHFSAGTIPDCWSLQHGGSGTIDNWDVTASNNSGGSDFELRSTFQHVNSGYSRLVLPALNTTGMASVNISFKYMLDDWAPGAELKLQSSTDGINWTDESWSLSTRSNTNIGPVTVNTSVVNNLGLPATYLAFVVTGDLHQYDFWYIDDVTVSCTAFIPVNVQATADPPFAGQVSGSGIYPFGQEVELLTQASPGWGFLNWTEEGNVVSTYPELRFPANSHNLVAHFSNDKASLGLEAIPMQGGNTSGGGIYALGSVVTATAAVSPGFAFDGWYNDGVLVSTALQVELTLQRTTNLEAHFRMVIPETYTLQVDAVPSQGGKVSGSGVYIRYSATTVFAIPYPGWIFDSWQEGGVIISRNPAYTLSMTGNRSLQAKFRQLVSICTTVYPAEAGFASGGGDFLSGDDVTLQAWANPGWQFKGWAREGTEVSGDSVFFFQAENDICYKAEFQQELGEKEAISGKLKLFPNPSGSYVYIESGGDDIPEAVTILNMEGREIDRFSWPEKSSRLFIDTGRYLPGTYLVKILSPDESFVALRLVVTR